MKKALISLTILILLVLSACTTSDGSGDPNPGSDENNGSSQDSESTGSGLNPDYENALSVNLQLLFGTMALEDTDYPVLADQSENLLPLWKAARALSDSETAAEEELVAVYTQIQNTLNADQVKAIGAMELTQEDLLNIAESHGIEIGLGGGFDFDNMTPEQQAAREAAREYGGPGGGGFPGGGGGLGGGPGGEGLDPAARETAIAERGGAGRFGGGAGRINPVFFEGIITFLEAIAQ